MKFTSESFLLPEQARQPRLLFLAIGSTLAGILTLIGWYAGHTSGALDQKRQADQVTQIEQDLASTRIELRQERQQRQLAVQALESRGAAGAIAESSRLRKRLSEAEAAISQYRSLLKQQQGIFAHQEEVLSTLSNPALRVIALKGAADNPAAQGCTFVLPDVRLILVASKLAALPGGRTYQVWVQRTSDSAPVSGGLFVPDGQGHAVVQIENSALASDQAGIAITDEPDNGSLSPTGSKVLTGSIGSDNNS